MRLLAVASILLLPAAAHAVTYQVGPGRESTQPSDVADLLAPGDVVEVDGGATYGPVRFDVDATEGSPITIRGVGDTRPIISGGDTHTVVLSGNHYVVERLEVTGGARTCIFQNADGTVIRDTVVHGCPAHGILGSDQESGDLLLDHVEVYDCGGEPPGEALKHSVYIATDEELFPGSVFRMQHSYVHDTNGGNAVKSRAERAEIYYNWIEGAQYYELEMIGPDDGIGTGGLREDGDVVGNVFFQRGSQSYVTRIGGDGTGESQGRYRFVNNVYVVEGSGAMRCGFSMESVEFHNNVFVRTGGGALDHVFRSDECDWVGGEQVLGTNNWIPAGSGSVPAGLIGTIEGTDPGFVDLAGRDVRLAEGSALIDVGTQDTVATWDFAVPDPLALPAFHPPFHGFEAPGAELPRGIGGGAVDLGAYEFGADVVFPPDAGPNGGGGDDASGGCGCAVAGPPARGSAAGAAVTLAIMGLLTFWRRRRS